MDFKFSSYFTRNQVFEWRAHLAHQTTLFEADRTSETCHRTLLLSAPAQAIENFASQLSPNTVEVQLHELRPLSNIPREPVKGN